MALRLILNVVLACSSSLSDPMTPAKRNHQVNIQVGIFYAETESTASTSLKIAWNA